MIVELLKLLYGKNIGEQVTVSDERADYLIKTKAAKPLKQQKTTKRQK